MRLAVPVPPRRSPPTSTCNRAARARPVFPKSAPPYLQVPDDPDTHNTLLWMAAKDGDTAQMQRLLEEQSDPDFIDGAERTALHVASMNGHTAAMTILLDNGWNINAKNAKKYTPLMLASERGEVAAVLGEF